MCISKIGTYYNSYAFKDKDENVWAKKVLTKLDFWWINYSFTLFVVKKLISSRNIDAKGN